MSFGSSTAFLVLVPFLLEAQTSYSTLERSPDAREVAMGESFVAGPLSSFSIENNPANLSRLRGVTTFYSYRDLRWFEFIGKFQISGTGVMVESPIGNIALLYKRFTIGEIIYSTSLDPEGLGAFTQVDHSYILGYAARITNAVAFGLNAKVFYRNNDVHSGSMSIPGSKNSYLFDLGLLYSVGGITSVPHVSDQLNAGFALQNFGSDFETALSDNLGPNRYFVGKLPRFFRAGISYSLVSHPDELFEELSVLITSEYKRYLNAQVYEKYDQNFWGFGLEISALQIAAIRLGGVIQPYSDVFADEGQVAMRYGVGIILPAKMLGLSCPWKASFDYTMVPTSGSTLGYKKTLPAIQMQLHYEFTQND